jgi:hypothetical protein
MRSCHGLIPNPDLCNTAGQRFRRLTDAVDFSMLGAAFPHEGSSDCPGERRKLIFRLLFGFSELLELRISA